MLGGLPIHGLVLVLGNTFTVGVKSSQVELRRRISLFVGLQVPQGGLGIVLREGVPRFVQGTKFVLGSWGALVG